MTNEIIAITQGQSLPKPSQNNSDTNTLIQVFCASTNEAWLQSLLDDIIKYYPKATVIGASSAEAIIGGQIVDSAAVISISHFESTTISAMHISGERSCYEAGKKIVKKLKQDNTKAFIVLTDAASVNGEELLDGITHESKGIVTAGGLASTHTFTNTFVIFGDKIIKNGVVAAALHSDILDVHQEHAFGWQAIGQEMIITKAERHRVDFINGKTPLSIFKKYLGNAVTKELPGIGSAFPLMIKRGDVLVARGILWLEGESFVVSGNVKVGDKVHIGYGNSAYVADKNEIVKRLSETIGKPDAVFSYYCLGRKLFLPRKTLEFEAKNLSQVGSVGGFFTLGEFYTEDKMARHLNFSSTVIALREGAKQELKYKRLTPPKPDFVNTISDGLFNFIDTRTKELDFMAYHDPLTALANRSLLADRAEHALSYAKRYGYKTALLFLDIDRFKIINDTLGHEVGDGVLAAIAKKIKKTLRSEDTLARIGGDEFVILLDNVEGERHAAQIASRLLEVCAHPIQVGSKKLSVTASIGIAIFPEDGSNYQKLIKNADTAMYQAKMDGRNGYAFYRKELTAKAEKRLQLQNELKIAIQKDQFVLVYQPQIDLKTKKLIGIEALIRWNHPKKGITAPGYFLDEAEECGLMSQIGDVVVKKACEQIKAWEAKGFVPPKLSVNITAEEFWKNDLAKKLSDTIEQYAVNPARLQIEITETGIMQSSASVHEELKKINDMGIGISIDDFGTGYSSLSYLKKLPVQEIKIDRSFVSEIATDTGNQVIVKAILAIAKELGLDVIAEGIETEEQAAYLLSRGCRRAQGYLYAKPMHPNVLFEKYAIEQK